MGELERINQGNFDQKIQLLEGVVLKDSKSSPIRTFTVKHTQYAQVIEVNSQEAVTNEASRMITRIQVTTYIAPVNNRWRLNWEGNSYDVISAAQIQRTPFMKLEAIKIFK